MAKWEYKTLVVTSTTVDVVDGEDQKPPLPLTETLASLGDDSWELTSTMSTGQMSYIRGMLIFRREKQ